MINPSTYEGYSEGLVLLAEGIEFQILAMYATLMKQLASNPDGFLQYSRQADNIVRQYSRGVVEWADTDLADAYIAGLRHTDAEMAEIKPQAKRVQAPRSNQALTATVLTTAEATRKAAQKFKRFAEHVGFYETFKAAAIDKLKDVSVQILRDTRDVYRQIAIETGLDKFRASEVATRRQISQDMLNRFADRGVTGIRYKDGSRRTLTAYTEVVARTMSGHAAMQASMNRYQEYGYDLVRISWYVKRLRTADGEPVGIHDLYIPPTLEFAPQALQTMSSYYRLLHERHGIEPERATERFTAKTADAEEAALLRVPEGTALLTIERLTFDATDRAIEYVALRYRADNYHYRVEMRRKR